MCKILYGDRGRHNQGMNNQTIPDRFPVLADNGLVLRELTEADLPAWFARLSDSDAAALAGDPVATSMNNVIEGLKYHQQAFREKEGLRWAIALDPQQPGVGSIGFDNFNDDYSRAAIGAALGRDHWGLGIATHAGRLVLDYGFSVLGLIEVWAVVLPENVRVIRVLEKLGFTPGSDAGATDRKIGDRTDTLFYCVTTPT